jgi:hypothetical protein
LHLNCFCCDYTALSAALLLSRQLSKSDKELKALKLKLKQVCARLDKMQAAAAKMQEMAAGMVADAQAGLALD